MFVDALDADRWVLTPGGDVLVCDEYGAIDYPATLRALLTRAVDAEVMEWAMWLTPHVLPAAARPLLAQLLERVASWWAAQRVDVIAAIDAAAEAVPPPPQPAALPLDEADPAVLDVAAACDLTPAGAWRELEITRSLQRLPSVLAALREGRIPWTVARAIGDQASHLSDEDAAELDRGIAALLARVRTYRKALNLARKLAIAIDPKGSERRWRERKRGADATLRRLPEGGTLLTTEFDGVDGPIVMAQIEALAARLEAEGTCSGGAARVEAHRRLVLAGAAGLSACPCCGPETARRTRTSRRRGRTQVVIHVPLDTAMGVSDAPGWVEGWGPVTAQQLRQRIFDDELCTWSRLIYDPLTGVALDVGRTRYRPPKPLLDLIHARDGGCTMPTCDHTAATRTLVADHEKSWAEYGETADTNLHTADEGCHVHRHQGGWTITHDSAGGTVTWTDRFGNAYTSYMADYRPPATATDEDMRAWLLRLLAQPSSSTRPTSDPRPASEHDSPAF